MPNEAERQITDRTANPKRLDPDLRRAQLLKHAIVAFAEAGIERAVHADVAARAKVSTPTVFKYFPTREALVDAVLGEIETAFADLDGMKSGAVKMELTDLTPVLADLISLLCVNRPNLMKVALMWSVAFSPIRERFKAFEKLRLDDLQEMVSSRGFTRSDAQLFFSMMFMFVRMHFDDTPSETRSRYVDRMREMLESLSTTASAEGPIL